MANLLQFNQISKNDVPLVGGKGASLGEMTTAGIPVPPGFVVTTEVYKQFNNQELPIDIQEEILKAFDSLGADRVAVRSSAVAEDSKTASWAGQLETYLNVPKEDLIDRLRDCWNSIRTEQALAYATEQNISEDQLVVAVVIQKMIESEAAGVMFTINPLNKDTEELMIEAGYGLGEMLVQGMITPDSFIIDKNSLEIKTSEIQTQEIMMIFQDGENKEVPVPDEQKSEPAITEDEIKGLANLGIKIENHYGSPQDIEWALEKNNLYILQSRPITTL